MVRISKGIYCYSNKCDYWKVAMMIMMMMMINRSGKWLHREWGQRDQLSRQRIWYLQLLHSEQMLARSTPFRRCELLPRPTSRERKRCAMQVTNDPLPPSMLDGIVGLMQMLMVMIRNEITWKTHIDTQEEPKGGHSLEHNKMQDTGAQRWWHAARQRKHKQRT